MIEAETVRLEGGITPDRGRIAVYSCHFGRHEPFHDHALGPEGPWDRVIFTDQADLVAPGRRVVVLPEGFEGLTAKQASRLPKLMPERFLARHDWVIYVDNRARLLMPPDAVVARVEAAQGGEARRGAIWRNCRSGDVLGGSRGSACARGSWRRRNSPACGRPLRRRGFRATLAFS